MLTLQGQYQVAPNKRLVILAEPEQPLKGGLLTDLEALNEACSRQNGRCEVQVNTQSGLMQGTLVEKQGRQFNRRQYEGYLAFLPRG